MKENQEIKIKSLQKAIEVLNCFVKKPILGVTEISKTLDLYKGNVHNILGTYKAMGYGICLLLQKPPSRICRSLQI